MKRRLAVRAVIEKDSELLLVRLKPYENALGNDFWCTIGGTIEVGEEVIPALKREVKEETGIDAVVGNLLYVQQFKTADTEHVEFFFHVTNTDDFMNIDLSKTTHGQVEIAEIGFVDPKTVHVLPEFLKTEDYSNLNEKSVTFFSEL